MDEDGRWDRMVPTPENLLCWLPKILDVFENQKRLKKFQYGHYLWVKYGEEIPRLIYFRIRKFVLGENKILAGGCGGGGGCETRAQNGQFFSLNTPKVPEI